MYRISDMLPQRCWHSQLENHCTREAELENKYTPAKDKVDMQKAIHHPTPWTFYYLKYL